MALKLILNPLETRYAGMVICTGLSHFLKLCCVSFLCFPAGVKPTGVTSLTVMSDSCSDIASSCPCLHAVPHQRVWPTGEGSVS